MHRSSARHTIGLISDTHGLVRPGVHGALSGVDLILHAGDVGGEDVLQELSAIAPVRAVFGNTDPPGVGFLQKELELEISGVTIHVSHGHELGNPTPGKLLERYAARVIVYGHTHQHRIERTNSRIVINPGAAGPRRFKLEPSVAILTIRYGVPHVQILPLARDDHRA